jgi:hypothetical protein
MQIKMAFVLALVALSNAGQTAQAQLGLGYPYYSPYAYGGWGYYGGWGSYNYGRTVALDTQLASQSRAMAQNAVVQSGIRSTLADQAQARTEASLSQRQAGKDWWFQTQQQQIAARQARGPMSSASVSSQFEPSGVEIIDWPSLLREPVFSKQRARVEDPYLRSSEGLSEPTAADYRDMVDATAEMKELLAQRVAFDYGLPAGQFAEASKFLDNLASEARGRAEKLQSAVRPATKPAKKNRP